MLKLISLVLFVSFNLMAFAQSEYKLVWADEFETSTVDTNKWSYATGSHGWGNKEWQNYTNGKNSFVSDGTLKIVAKLEGEGQKAGDYSSSRMLSKKSFTYGRYEIKAKIPTYKGNGLWPAIWMLGDNIKEIGWPNCGEIDIMEYVSYAPDTMYFTIHSIANNHKNGTEVGSGSVFVPTVEEEFHTYGITWTETYLEFYLDDVSNVKFRFERPVDFNQDNWPFDKPFFFLLNIAVGGNWGGKYGVDDTIFPAIMEIDYVRVYQLEK